ncbi:MAG: branched-chain-amino-acid transaminase [Planctomycetes bacterium]|jgi:branched-chain amino acid aminotransferase|nr:branched-chain-amino-acid transaminase [Phycisphaerae bacterium]NBB94854.1 branched-chain-amino-acid transaminase [Planctomycetota bacterium]
MKIWMNGNLVDQSDAKVSVFDHGVLYGDGVFEGIRVYGGRIFQCTAHLDRLFESASLIRLEIAYSAEQLEEAMVDCVEANSLESGYIRLVVTRGPGTLGLDPFKCPQPNVFIIADQLKMYDEEMYQNGMAIILADTVRVSPSMIPSKVKSLNYLNNILAKIEAVDAGVSEAMMLNAAGQVSECTGDNIFLVRDGKVITPPLAASVLPGITRNVVMHLAQRLGYEVRQEAFGIDTVYAADECFLTGTGAEVIAVTSVDGNVMGDGNVGPVTQTLLHAFRALTETDEQIPYDS